MKQKAPKVLPHLLSKATQLMIVTGFFLPVMLHAHETSLITLTSNPLILKDSGSISGAPLSAPLLSSTHQPTQTALYSQPLQPYRFHEDHVLGTSFDMIAMATHQDISNKALQAAQAEIARLDKILSQYRSDSELTLLNNSNTLKVSKDLFNVIQASETWQQKTAHGFNGRLGLPLRTWHHATASNQLPDTAELHALTEQASIATVQLDKPTHTIHRPDSVVFAVDAIAKGYIIDAALHAARNAAPELAGLMIDIGGDLRCWGQAPRCEGWQIGVADAKHHEDNAPTSMVIHVKDKAVATSGKGARDVCIDGCNYAHILLPHTGASAEHIIRATVVADTAADADALSTAFIALTPEKSLELIHQLPGVEALLVTKEGQQLASNGWHALLDTISLSPSNRSSNQPAARPLQFAQAPSATLTDASSAASKPWPAGFNATIDYEVPKIESDQYRAPYVAIWITNEKKELVKTLLLLGNDSKYLNENYIWWRRFGRKAASLDTITKPTRQPGKYNVSWNGLDEAGNKVAQGRYLLHIEAAREHGGHSYESLELDLNTTNLKKTLPAKDEIGIINVKYGK
ncbi:MAG: DUF2271 domain-containing protein [Pseudomonadota bacterium]